MEHTSANKVATEHNKFIDICNTIKYEIDTEIYNIWRNFIRDKETKQCTQCFKIGIYDRITNVREIIYTQEFMEDYFNEFWRNHNEEDEKSLRLELLENLDDPVSYLYNLLGWQIHENK